MKKYLLIAGFSLLLAACTGSKSGPDVCDCLNNAYKLNTPEFDKDFQKKCEEYAKNISKKENESRMKDAEKRGCIK